ncbi:hypothetical protein [Streptomyces gardneri]|uniref:hypothetical protein n=1 Tax=Streptomyces gardneri TaxID=66892 RepID=UPI0035D570B3
MGLFTRTSKPTAPEPATVATAPAHPEPATVATAPAHPEPATVAAAHPEPATVAAGMAVFVADLLAGDRLALDLAGPIGEMPFTAQQWAAYPNDPYRLERREYFGGPSPLPLPEQAGR